MRVDEFSCVCTNVMQTDREPCRYLLCISRVSTVFPTGTAGPLSSFNIHSTVATRRHGDAAFLCFKGQQFDSPARLGKYGSRVREAKSLLLFPWALCFYVIQQTNLSSNQTLNNYFYELRYLMKVWLHPVFVPAGHRTLSPITTRQSCLCAVAFLASLVIRDSTKSTRFSSQWRYLYFWL